jgi:hypothetical protein
VSESTKPRRVSTTIASIVTIVALVVAGVAIYQAVGKRTVASSCTVDVRGTTYTLAPDQATNATTITAVGKRIGLPDHAVTVALAAALQESNLHNLSHGDRDSLGLFQQRPSQGWGTPSQVQDPVYAATAFFTHLATVNGWENLSVAAAAQEVQHSGAPAAYANWVTKAKTIAIATTGEVPAAFTCDAPAPSAAAIDPALQSTMNAELGSISLGTTMPVGQGWTVASWLVAHARRFGVRTVTFDGRRWTRSSATWQPHQPAVASVQIEVGP